MLKIAAAAVALAWATTALAQDAPPQERIHERLNVTFRDAAGEFSGRLALSDVTASHSAVEGYLQGPDGYVFYCEPTLLAEADAVQIATDAKSAVADVAHLIPLLSCPEVELQGGGPPGSLSLECAFDGRRAEVIRRTQRSVGDEPAGSVAQTERVASTVCEVAVNGVAYSAAGTLSWMKETRTGAYVVPPQFPE
jgi:hypothetical protein